MGWQVEGLLASFLSLWYYFYSLGQRYTHPHVLLNFLVAIYYSFRLAVVTEYRLISVLLTICSIEFRKESA